MYNGLTHRFYYGPRIYCRELWPEEYIEKVKTVTLIRSEDESKRALIHVKYFCQYDMQAFNLRQ